MSLKTKLRTWKDAGLIDEDTLANITAFESRSNGPRLVYALGGLGAFTIGVGLISTVAANWQDISDLAKIFVDLLVGVAIAWGIWRLHKAKQIWQRDALILVYYLFTLTSMALVGQIYHWDPPLYRLLLAWTMATAPVVLLGSTTFLAWVWGLGLAVTYGACVVQLTSWIEAHKVGLSPDVPFFATYFAPFLFLLLSEIAPIKMKRPRFRFVFVTLAWAFLVAMGFAAQFAWYADISGDETIVFSALLAVAPSIGAAVALPRMYPNLSPSSISALRTVLLSVFAVTVLPFLFTHEAIELVGALSNLAFMCVLGWAALRLQWSRFFGFVTAYLGLRIVLIYFEVFGSMLSTGLGLITGGMLTVLVAWLWYRKSPRVMDHFEQMADEV
ncbi:MAG: DUF2157 domain-containing protein [Myxococcales bacterium]|nr:MAG: DUF2157 domain-containing protein [Myxococcales bacterium]